MQVLTNQNNSSEIEIKKITSWIYDILSIRERAQHYRKVNALNKVIESTDLTTDNISIDNIEEITSLIYDALELREWEVLPQNHMRLLKYIWSLSTNSKLHSDITELNRKTSESASVAMEYTP